MQRFKNYALWTAVAALVGMGLVDFGVIPNTELYDQYIDKLLYILVLAGVVTNPSQGKGFSDKSEARGGDK
jgi:uncharacterized membrane protein